MQLDFDVGKISFQATELIMLFVTFQELEMLIVEQH